MWNIAYEKNERTHHYMMQWCGRDTAVIQLAKFLNRYGNGANDLRPYPNGEGYYRFTNPRLVQR